MIYKKTWKYILIRDYPDYGYYRPKSLKDFSDVYKNDIGGYLERYRNLSQFGDCWIYDEALVINNSKVSENAMVAGKASIDDNVEVYGNAKVSGHAYISENAKVYGNAIVFGRALIYGNAQILGDAVISGDSVLKDNAFISQ